METIDTFDVKKAIVDSVTEVFDTMLSMDIQYFEQVHQSYLYGERILGSVNLVGAVMGIVNIQISKEFSREITSAMLGIEDEEIEGLDEIKDVLGEVCNMVGGNLKSNLCDAGLTCELSTPALTTGKDYRCDTRDMTRNEYMTFYHGDHTILVDVGMKASDLDNGADGLFADASKSGEKIDLQSFSVENSISKSVPEVFDMMLEMEVDACDPDSVEMAPNVNRIAGSISMSGAIQGRLNIHTTEEFSREMTAAMLGIEVDEIEGLDEVKDVVGEICNMISGTLKSDLCDAGFNCVLSPPSFTTGSDFEMKLLQLSRREEFAYRCMGDAVMIVIGLEPSEH
ncbi:MAG: chemotaxis protein CheX [Desulfobacterales bacterium]|nr:chemotaxis protein CheX [Desulfobacterales bacterium]